MKAMASGEHGTGNALLPPACCGGVALFCMTAQSLLLNNAIFPVTTLVAPLAREWQTAAGIAVGLVLLLAAQRRPGLARPDRLLPAALACAVAGAAALPICVGSGLATTACLCGRSLGVSLELYLAGLAFAQAADPRSVALSAAFAFLLAALGSTIGATWTASVPLAGVMLADVVLTLACFAVTRRHAVPALRAIASGHASELLALANPRAFLSPANRVFMLMFVFSTASGFAHALRVTERTSAASWASLAVLALVAALFVRSPRERRHEDGLFAAAAVLIVAGLSVTPVGGLGGPAGSLGPMAANSLLYAGSWLFRILMWTSVAAMCSRNMAGALGVLACVDTYGGVGTFAGAELGHLCNALLERQPDAAALVTGTMVVALFAYVLLGLRGFSFAETIDGIEPQAPLPAVVPAAPSRDERIDAACACLGGRAGLTDRELQVMGMLARGHNGYHIRDELTVSYNTVKTHVQRVYRKLGVHSQQELIDLVEGAGGAAGEG